MRTAAGRDVVNVVDLISRQGFASEDSPYGSVGVVHSGADLQAWSVWKDDEELEPSRAVMDHDDLIYVIRGSLRLELQGGGCRVLSAGQLYVIPAGTPFRGYRWPRDGEPCSFLAVAPAGARFERV